ncbi:hypothetical protein D3C87_279620 [compost metagenome]
MLRTTERAGADKNHSLEVGSPEYIKVRYPGVAGRNDTKPVWLSQIQRDKLLKTQDRWKHSLIGHEKLNGHPAKRAIVEDLSVCIKNGLKLKTRTFEYEPSTGELKVEGQHLGIYDAKRGGLASFTLLYTNTALARLRLRDFGINLVKKNKKTYWRLEFHNVTSELIRRYVLNHPGLKWWFKNVTYVEGQNGNSVFIRAELFENIRYNVNLFASISSFYNLATTLLSIAYPGDNVPTTLGTYSKCGDSHREFYKHIDYTFSLPAAAEKLTLQKFLKPIVTSILNSPVAIAYFLGRMTRHSLSKYVGGIPDNIPYIGTSEKLKLHHTLCIYNGTDKTSLIAFVLVSALEANVKVILKNGIQYDFPLKELVPDARVNDNGYLTKVDSFEQIYLLIKSRPNYTSSQIRLADDTGWGDIDSLTFEFHSAINRVFNFDTGNLLTISRAGKMVEPFLGKEILISSTEYTDLIKSLT